MCYKMIANTEYEPIDAEVHTEEIKTMIDLMLQKDWNIRPNIDAVLNHPIVVAKREEYGL